MTAAHVAALASLGEVGPVRLRWLLSRGEPVEVWEALGAGHLRAGSPGGGAPTAELLARWRAEADSGRLDRMDEALRRCGVRVSWGDDLPGGLSDDAEAPGAIFSTGAALQPVARVAVVGTRRATPYGLRQAERLGAELAEAGVSVVSGLALGIDAAAHRGALLGRGVPVAVIGAGHDRPCPRRNRAIAAELERCGTILSEVPPGVPSAPWRYPARNRLIAALADVVIVVESASKGGSMLTVAAALERDRAVMAVPGPIDSGASTGCHDLLREGAEVCAGAEDVVCLLGLTSRYGGPADGIAIPAEGDDRMSAGAGGDRGGDHPAVSSKPELPLGPLARAVLSMVTAAPAPLEAVVGGCGAGLAEAAAAVGELERAGLVVQRAGWIERRR